MLTPDFGKIFGVPLVNNLVTFEEINIDINKPFKAILLSDCHLGCINPTLSPKLFNESLNKLIEQEKPTKIFILGDLVDGTQSSEFYQNILNLLKNFDINFYIIGGNHDRDFINNSLIIPSNVFINNFNSFKLIYNKINIFLTHDLLNNYRVRDHYAFFFVLWLKNGCSNFISLDDWLITAHTHTGFLNNNYRIGSIGQFSPEIKVFSYSTLEFFNEPLICIKALMNSEQIS